MRAKQSTRAFLVAVAASATAVAATAIPASAHMGLVTYGTTFTANATNHIYFRVPHGCPDVDAATHGGFNARTTKVEVNIPAAVTGVKPEQKPGWDVAVTRDPVTTAVTQIVWTARVQEDSLADWTFADFGVRATLNGAAGDVIAFPSKQYCDKHNDLLGPDPVGLIETWAGVDAPKLTLVSANKVTSAADLADLKGRVTALETSVAGALSSIAGLLNTDTSLTSRLATAESSLSGLGTRMGSAEGTLGNVAAARLGYVSAQKGTSGRLGLTVDLPTIYRNQTVTVKVNGVVAKSLLLNSVGDGAAVLTKAASAPFSAGQQVQVLAGATVVATSAVG